MRSDSERERERERERAAFIYKNNYKLDLFRPPKQKYHSKFTFLR